MFDSTSLTLVQWVVLLSSYPILMATSGRLVVWAGSRIKGDEGEEVDPQFGRAGKIIGKCENFLVLTFVFAGEFTALAVIFAAEGIISLEYDDDHYPTYFLSGTMVNFTYSIAIALAFVGAVTLGPDVVAAICTAF